MIEIFYYFAGDEKIFQSCKIKEYNHKYRVQDYEKYLNSCRLRRSIESYSTSNSICNESDNGEDLSIINNFLRDLNPGKVLCIHCIDRQTKKLRIFGRLS